MSIAYLKPNPDRFLRHHRRLLIGVYPRLPRPAAWLLTTWFWSRFVGWSAWRAARRITHLHGQAVTARHGVGRRKQRALLLRAALLDGISPIDFHRFDLYHPTRYRLRWQYVFENETSTFHQLRDPHRGAGASRAFLADKAAFADTCKRFGLAVAPSVARLRPGSTTAALPHGPNKATARYIAKPRIGSGSRGIFVFDRVGNSLNAWTLDGRPLKEPMAQSAEKLLSEAEYLVQPLLASHHALHHVGACRTQSTVVRVITRRIEGRTTPWCAYLEAPVTMSKAVGFATLTIDAVTGAIDSVVRTSDGQEFLALADQLWEQARGTVIPDWEALVQLCCSAHELARELSAIAWDVVPTPDGPILLEGNSGWSTAVPQLIRGPLLPEFFD